MALTLDQLAWAVQAVSVFRELTLEWREPIDTLLDLAKLLTFDLNMLRSQCFIKVTTQW